MALLLNEISDKLILKKILRHFSICFIICNIITEYDVYLIIYIHFVCIFYSLKVKVADLTEH